LLLVALPTNLERRYGALAEPRAAWPRRRKSRSRAPAELVACVSSWPPDLPRARSTILPPEGHFGEDCVGVGLRPGTPATRRHMRTGPDGGGEAAAIE